MNALLSLCRLIDAVNIKIGRAVSWLLLLAVLICSINAMIRYTFHIGSNAWLEIQWYLFGAVFLLASAYTLRRNEHVRIDVIVSRFSKRTQAWIDLFGFALFLMPITLLVLYYGIPFAWESIRSQEMSSNAGGLIVWPAKLLVPVGFFLLALQGISEMVKRIGFLMGRVEASEFEKHVVTPEQEIAAIKAANKIA